MTNFKTTTPRVVTITLDLNEKKLKFWLNGKRFTEKDKLIEGSGPWTPSIKISKEKNKIILNPFAREPQDNLPMVT
jgi:hypothetical protein